MTSLTLSTTSVHMILSKVTLESVQRHCSLVNNGFNEGCHVEQDPVYSGRLRAISSRLYKSSARAFRPLSFTVFSLFSHYQLLSEYKGVFLGYFVCFASLLFVFCSVNFTSFCIHMFSFLLSVSVKYRPCLCPARASCLCPTFVTLSGSFRNKSKVCSHWCDMRNFTIYFLFNFIYLLSMYLFMNYSVRGATCTQGLDQEEDNNKKQNKNKKRNKEK